MRFRSTITTAISAILLAAGTATASIIIPSPANDVALSSAGAVAFADSQLIDTPPHGLISNLNDGDRDGNYTAAGGNGVAHDNGTGNPPYMGVLLPSNELLASVNVFNRTDGTNGQRLDNNGTTAYTLEIVSGGNGTLGVGTIVYSSTQLFSANINQTAGADTAAGQTFTLPSGTSGNEIVVIQNYHPSYMNLAEIEAFAVVVPEPSSCILLGLAAVGLLLAARRSRRK